MGAISQYLLTRLVNVSLGDDGVDTVEETLFRVLKHLDYYRLSSIEVILEIRADKISMRGKNNQELEAFDLSSVLRCDCCINPSSLHDPSLLLLVCQSSTQKMPSVYLFSCTTVRAERIRDDIKQAVSHRENRCFEPNMDVSGIPSPPYSQVHIPPSNHPPPPYPGIKANGLVNGQPDKSFLKAQLEVEILNHCFDDIEAFMGKLQQSAEAQMILNQRSKKQKRSQRKSPDEDLLTAKAKPPSEKEFIETFQKFKYSFSLLSRLKSIIFHPTAEELVHHVFKPLDMIVKVTGGPGLAGSVSSPAMTQGAVTLLQNNLTTEDKELWVSLGPNWTQHKSALRSPVAPYTPLFLDGWRPAGSDVSGWVDPVEAQHKQDAKVETQLAASHPSDRHTAPDHTTDQHDGPVKERLYRCSYDFVARNNSELSVMHGETLEVIESSKRWWKCRNKFDEVGFVPFNILEPITHIDNAVTHKTPKPPVAPPIFNALPSPSAFTSDPSNPRPRSMGGQQHLTEDTDKVMQVNDELLQRLTSGKNLTPRLVIPRSPGTTAPLDFSSPPDEVENWLKKKGFSQPTVQCLKVLNGAQLFSLKKEELRAVIPEEGARVYSQLTVQRALLEDARRSSELETVMERQKMKVDLKMESETL